MDNGIFTGLYMEEKNRERNTCYKSTERPTCSLLSFVVVFHITVHFLLDFPYPRIDGVLQGADAEKGGLRKT